MNAPSPEESAAEIRRDAAEQAAQLAGMAKQHAAKQMARAKQVQQSGTPAEKSAVAEDINRSNTVLNVVKKLLGGGA
jgi:F0F1-type ATP synthase membrane subunit b/b'